MHNVLWVATIRKGMSKIGNHFFYNFSLWIWCKWCLLMYLELSGNFLSVTSTISFLSNSPCMPSSPWAIIHVLSPHSYFEWNIISVKYISSSQHLIFSSLTFPFYIPNCNVDISWYIIIFLLITLLDTNKYT